MQVRVLEKEEETSPEEHPFLRKAGLKDVPVITGMAEKLLKYVDMPIPHDPRKIRQTVEMAISSDDRDFMVLMAHDKGQNIGCISAYRTKPLFSDNYIALEVLWWLEPEYRTSKIGLGMMEAIEHWSKLVGCTHIQYGFSPSMDKGMQNLYSRTGCKVFETVYYKELL